MGGGLESIDDELEFAAIRNQARRIRLRATLTAAFATLGLLLLP